MSAHNVGLPARQLTGDEAGPVLISHPKSGRTWVRFMFAQAGASLKCTHLQYGSSGAPHLLGTPFDGLRAPIPRGRRLLFLHRNPIDTAVSYYFQIHQRIGHLTRQRRAARQLPAIEKHPHPRSP